MSIHVVTKEQIKHSLDAWYQSMLQQHVEKATSLKEEIDGKIAKVEEDQNLLLYYALLDFRYKVLTDSLSITKNSFDVIKSYNKPSEEILSYYYHFFKAIHATLTTNYNEAREYYEKAQRLLQYVPDEIGKAEFNYRLASFYYHVGEAVQCIQYTEKAKEVYSKHLGYEIGIALCDNALASSYLYLKQYEQAEVYYTSAINILNKQNEEILSLRIRYNLGLMYAKQNMSSLAIRYVSEVSQKIPNHFKAIFVEARERSKLGENKIAAELVVRGEKICEEVNNIEYQHRFKMLKLLNQKVSASELEKDFQAGISYFEKEGLWECIQEYAAKLAIQFHHDEVYQKASEYFYMSHEINKKILEKGALK
ncbi:Rap family tetratricopeptide repeat protein [Bacillus sp. XF8]|uniref:Rap family tetratricopeptide repeat protein n=1 Tax=Bacillus sp. XF8 TaxID=2819289 RepID=UPI001FB6C217|nr:Rap family tetratricopeptide repeat protein [Bacillus sp. XF8]